MAFRVWQPWVTVGVVGALLNDAGQLLIVEHVFHPKFPWGLPGGWMNRGEEPEQTIRREMLEETSLHITVIKPLLISRTRFMPAHLDVAYLCRPQGDHIDREEIHLSSELLAYKWIDPRNPPPMAHFHTRVLRAALRELAAEGNRLEPLIEDKV